MKQKVIETNQANFNQEVIQRSYREPVIVDFWAPWCGPCRMLGPVLERVANEPDSGFILAKVNSDQNPGLSAQFDVRGIPAVKAFANGRVIDEFVGAQPEPVVRQFAQRVKSKFRPSTNKPHESRRIPQDPQERLIEARRYLLQGNGCQAQTLLENLPTGNGENEGGNLLILAKFMCTSGTGLAGSSNLETYYSQAAAAMNRREHSAALYNLLVAYNQDSSEKRNNARKLITGIFSLLGEDSLLTQQYKTLIN